jgi:NADH:ubiquinone oxidoreductase subunit F (NADH-binding)
VIIAAFAGASRAYAHIRGEFFLGVKVIAIADAYEQDFGQGYPGQRF